MLYVVCCMLYVVCCMLPIKPTYYILKYLLNPIKPTHIVFEIITHGEGSDGPTPFDVALRPQVCIIYIGVVIVYIQYNCV
jgi:hypothetical protein